MIARWYTLASHWTEGHEALRQFRLMAPRRLPIRAEPLQVGAQRLGRQAQAALRLRQDQEARVVVDQMELEELEFLGPGQRSVAPCGDIPQAAPGDLLEAQLETLVHQTVPSRPFVRRV